MPVLRSPFARRVAGVFGTRLVQFVFAFSTSILISRLLIPADKGVLVAVTTLPGMLAAIGMLGLPSATNYFAGKGNSVASLARYAVVFTVFLSIALIGAAWVALPALESSFLSAARGHDDMLRLMLLTLPLGMLATFGGNILYARNAVRAYNLIQLAQAALALLSAILLVGLLGFGVWGAVIGSMIVSTLYAGAVMNAVRQLLKRDRVGPPATARSLLSYGARLYPVSLTTFFNYRADSYILQAVMLNSPEALGLYSLAVTMAEVVFYVPESVSTIFLPRVAGSSVEDANRMLGRVARLSILLTVLIALALVPAAVVGVNLVLPAYSGCLPAFFVLLPGVVALSQAKVMMSYLAGRGRPGLISVATTAALVLNVALNLALIPPLGIVGASLASLVSYTVQAALTVALASRLSGQSALSLCVPGRAEVELLAAGLRRLAARARSSNKARPAVDEVR